MQPKIPKIRDRILGNCQVGCKTRRLWIFRRNRKGEVRREAKFTNNAVFQPNRQLPNTAIAEFGSNNPKRKWGFTCYIKDRSRKRKLLELIKPSYIKNSTIYKDKRSIKSFDPIYDDYFKIRIKFNNYRSHQTNNLAAGLQ